MLVARSIGIIGGADGPTAVFVTGRFPWELLLIGIICVAIVIQHIRKKK